MKSNKCLTSLIFLVAYLAGCALIPPDSVDVKRRDASQAQLAPGIRLARDGWPDACWWTRYQDPQLQRLINQALQDSPSLAISAARVKLAEAKWAGAEAAAGINVELGAALTRQRFPEHDIYPPPLAGTWQSQPNLQLASSAEIDWWGRNRAAIAAALGERYARRADLATAERLLAAGVAQSYFTWLADEERLGLLTQQMRIQQALVTLAKRRVRVGLDTTVNQHALESEHANVSNQLAAQQTKVRLDLEALRAMVGGHAYSLEDLIVVPLPPSAPSLPPVLGLNLLARRPDLQAARWTVESAVQTTLVDKAAFYPDVNLTAFFGYSVIGTELLLSSNRNPGAGISFSLPIFDSGRLKARLSSSRAQRDIAIAQYNQALINAVQEVADQGIALQGLSQQAVAQRIALSAVEAVHRANHVRLRQGLIDRATTLRSELPVLQQRDQLLQLRKAVLLADVALTNALGGGYDSNRVTDGQK